MSIAPEQASLETALKFGKMELQGQFLPGSNDTFLAAVHYKGQQYPAVYKPVRGEQPLWDFPPATLAKREVAACLVSQILGWGLVPLTVLRKGPFGLGSLQQFISYDPTYHYFTFSPEDKARLRPAAVFDLLVNNADRKGSHLLIEKNTQKLWLIDHGLCFHKEDKLRTVIWDFAGEPIPSELLAALQHLLAVLEVDPRLRGRLRRYLSPGEIEALTRRAAALLASPFFPHPPKHRRAFPYPPL
jgi:hypothetical protein